MKPGASYALRRLLEAALALLSDEDEELGEEEKREGPAAKPIQEKRQKFFGQESPPEKEPVDVKEV